MSGLFGETSKSESYGRTITHVIYEEGYRVTGENSAVYKNEFERRGFEYDNDKFKKICASMFSMLVISNMIKSSYIDEGDAIDAFLEEAPDECVVYLDKNHQFEKDLSERNLLRTEAAIWAGRKYFGEEPSRNQASLFNERADKFLAYVESSEEEFF